MTMETIFLIVLAAFNVWTIYFYNKLLLEVANDKEKEKKPPIDPMALVGKSLFKVSQLRRKEETEQKQTESMSVSDNDVTFDDSPKSTARISDEQLDDVFTNVRIEDIGVKYSDNLLAELKNRLKISIFLWRKKLCISLIFSNFVVSNYKVIYFTLCTTCMQIS